MPQSPLCLQAQPTPLAIPNHPIQPPPIHHPQPCHELLTELLIRVMHSELSEESSHERQD